MTATITYTDGLTLPSVTMEYVTRLLLVSR
jgi:hypothetical protein